MFATRRDLFARALGLASFKSSHGRPAAKAVNTATYWWICHHSVIVSQLIFHGCDAKYVFLGGPRCLCLRVVFRRCIVVLTFHSRQFCLAWGQCWMLRNWWGGVGWGGVNVPCTCTHVGCYAATQYMLTFLALAHMLDATQLMGLLGDARGGYGRGEGLLFLKLFKVPRHKNGDNDWFFNFSAPMQKETWRRTCRCILWNLLHIINLFHIK